MNYKPLSLDGTLDAKNVFKMSPVRFQVSSTKDECLLFPFLGQRADRGKSLPNVHSFMMTTRLKTCGSQANTWKIAGRLDFWVQNLYNRKSVAIESHMTGTTSNPAIRGPYWLLWILSCGSTSPDINWIKPEFWSPSRQNRKWMEKICILIQRHLSSDQNSYHIPKNTGWWIGRKMGAYLNRITSWWFQPLWKILVKMDHIPK